MNIIDIAKENVPLGVELSFNDCINILENIAERPTAISTVWIRRNK